MRTFLILALLGFSIANAKSHSGIGKGGGAGSEAANEKAPPSFHEPFVLNVSGLAFVTDAQDQKTKLTRDGKLRVKATIETGSGAWVRIATTKAEQLLIGPDSRVQIPVIAWEDGAIERIELEKGRMRLMNLGASPRVVVTEVSRDAYAEADLVFDYDPEKKALKLSVLEGRANFRGLENDEILPLNSGEEATFTGSIENGELAVDILLQGRRVARGKMSKVAKVLASTRETWAQAFAKMQKEDKGVTKHDVDLRSGEICRRPSAKFGLCSWTCEGQKGGGGRCRTDLPNVKCVRRRCDASGRWSDATEISAALGSCEFKTAVRACDY